MHNGPGDAEPAGPGTVAPSPLHACFDPSEVSKWKWHHFEPVRKLQEATRNCGQVHLMRHVAKGQLVAVKRMPNGWACSGHEEFVAQHPTETELPWQDIGCVRFLNKIGFDFACRLLGVHRDDEYTYVVTTFATEGDLFAWSSYIIAPGYDREVLVLPVVRQIMQGIQQLHDFSIVHRDISLENILLSKSDSGTLDALIIDFSMASTSRRFQHCVRGKAAYQAPEVHGEEEYDGLLSDAFAVGVCVYAVLLMQYPWQSTRPGVCKLFEYARKHGLRGLLQKQKLRGSTLRVGDVMSEPLKDLLEGLLEINPAKRLTLGERVWGEEGGRSSIWDKAWMSTGPGAAKSIDLQTTQPQTTVPHLLHTCFNPKEVAPWVLDEFKLIRKLQDAARNCGQVHLMHDVTKDRLVAVKQMPNIWICSCHEEFTCKHPSETELPWQDIGCSRFLNSKGFNYACELLGVYRDDEYTYVVMTFATEGDLFAWSSHIITPGHEREVILLPLVKQIMRGIQQMHDLSIVHRDISLENILLSKSDSDVLDVRIIDFSMASTSRRFVHSVRGKASYQAPEVHGDKEYDGFLSDAFSLGVTLYAIILMDYPWLSTKPGCCKCFEYVRKHGFRALLVKRKLRDSTERVGDIMSEPLKQLLEGLLEPTPAKRLTLGEGVWAEEGGRRSVWDEPWMQTGPGGT